MTKHTNLNLNGNLNENEDMHYGYEYPHTADEPVYEADEPEYRPSYMDVMTDAEIEALIYAF